MLKVISSFAMLFMATSSRRLSALEKHFAMNGDVIAPPLADNSTYGNTEEIHTTHVHLNLTVDFDTRQLNGQAYHSMEVLKETTVAQFDIWDLTIVECFNATDNSPMPFTVAQPNPLIGSVLQVWLPITVQAG